MAPKLFTFSSPSSLSPLHLTITNPSLNLLKLCPPKPFLILCKSTPQTEGTGAAAPTRGDIFLQHQQLKAASTAQIEIDKTKKKTKKKIHEKILKVYSTVPSCYGCGAPLQTHETDAPGYVDPDTYSLKKKHHQLRTILCGRCRLLSHGHMITAVGGHGTEVIRVESNSLQQRSFEKSYLICALRRLSI